MNTGRLLVRHACSQLFQIIIPDYPILTEEHQSDNSNGREVFNIAPGENKYSASLMTDKLYEEPHEINSSSGNNLW